MRSGTVPAALAVGLGEACAIAKREMKVCFYLCPYNKLLCYYIIT